MLGCGHWRGVRMVAEEACPAERQAKVALHNWWLFVVAVFLLSGTPGPNMLHVMTRSLTLGLRRSLATMAGCLAGLVGVLAASAAGLAALLTALPGLFDVLRYGGVAYLLYLGVRAWRADAAPLDPAEDRLPPATSAAALFRGGLLISISNPKLLLFAAAFLPQFVSPHAPQAPQFAILVGTFAVIETGWYLVYGAGGHALAKYLRRPTLKRAFNRLTGGLFIAFGIALLRVRPS
jgi:threonine/homoserine/homoserine lactone efflux protein